MRMSKCPGDAIALHEFAPRLRQCGIVRALEEGRRLHAQLIDTGLDTGTFLGNLLVQMYGKCGSVEDARSAFARIKHPNLYTGNIMIAALVHGGRTPEAREIFNAAPRRNLVSWNSMIAAYARTGQLLEAREMFDRLPQQDVVSCNLVMHGYIQESRIDKASEIFAAIEEPDSISCHTMLVAHAQIGRIDEAKAMFDRVPQNDVLSWNAMIQAFAQCGHFGRAKSLFDRMPERNVVAWTSIMVAYAKIKNFTCVIALFSAMPERDYIAWTVFLTAFAADGDVARGRAVLDRMPHHGIVAWNSLIQGAVQSEDRALTMALLDQIPERDIATHNLMIQASWSSPGQASRIFSRMPAHNVVSWTTLLAAFSQSGQIDRAREVFTAMPDRSPVSWTTMINALAHNGLWKRSIALFAEMDLDGARPDRLCFSAALDSCSSGAALREGRLLHAEAVAAGLEDELLVATALINMYGKCGRSIQARELFDRINRKDVVLWTAMFGAYAHSGDAIAVINLFPSLELEGSCASDAIALLAVLSACIHAGRLHDARRYFLSMIPDYGVAPFVDHFVCMVDLLGRGGQIELADDLVRSMPFQADCVAWTILLGACRIHRDVARGEAAAEKILELEPGNAGAFVQLLNLYEAAGMRSRAARIKRAMEERGIKRLPGRSSIQIHDTVHEFTVGDTDHPRREEIYAELRRIGVAIREAGYQPDRKSILHDVEEEEKEEMLCYHSEKLAIALGLIASPPLSTINVVKNLRVCQDCHTATKFISKVAGRRIVVRDTVRFHHFEGGACSCGDYW
ncbi:pentatricopeptide repeat-containing protein At4g02750 [Selaginella moellendorffii]|uniref:pentatricopeptide repeat-containing protein At4g02750 n=1 Tax=Selaginella moellendorffii TaxID=88036 RepID=UPI000D1CE246|nr:pentatricopeptide repeat-containing protein At4g02750 [Selaginella moellendorffii]|eukprot:XP_024544082.1 pentatricopeptide repeat-containing protein At4g02750 [Selaginella moellendorffii]